MTTVLEKYEARIESGQLTPDPVQATAAAALNDLEHRLANRKTGGWFSKAETVTGLYMWGGVGRGKSMLMDLFFESAPVEARRRVHFHEFMAEVHDRLDAWRKLSQDDRKRSEWRVKGAGDDPIAPVAKQIASEASLLCFDEFQVTQIADAMVLARLFEALFDMAVTVVATSNRHPNDLYKDGINRPLFLPFIEHLKAHCEILELASERDYRLDRLIEAPVWYSPLGPESEAALDRAWDRLTLGAEPQHCVLTVKGRKLEVQREAAGVARFTFEELCARPLGSRDYLAIAANFNTVILSGIPTLGPENRNEAARFVALIDALYEAKIKLVASAAAEPESLYPEGDGSFEFERTASRLHEMRSTDYLSEARVELEAD
ncbi:MULTISPECIES: cell division protein ZapE [unclassified Hyphomonas]|jgi:cell division protein ZapE|uniref:AFG1 family ATPase n=6 Tax=root TaxID=1 RepID=A0A1Y5I7N6_OSTTA|nr:MULTISPECIES: cell division protein ZapE [unclassified Hyphomonas]MAN90084.1 cell division protein ZapE [Hyphomonadaceae bacterium]OUS44717.1 AFG1 family ATPase [Ostreococcus tauri]MAA83361.1 cell division protein ZapE [Hyphomonas sp.]MDF1807138.1 cell division protein ZapE [Hyphomonas sp.]HCN93177.1 cell division protein ZapE [Hyphomonas sp.]|tara:strand:- start:13640 stop:14767 length:1128 start_codon:yes stop_codon:yes gene_type:complete